MRESQWQKCPSEFSISQILDGDRQSVNYILKASCLETYTLDLTMIPIMLPETMPQIPHISHH